MTSFIFFSKVKPYIFRYLPHNHNIKKLFHDIYFAFACFFEECAWLLWHLYDCSITLNMSCNLMKKYTIIGRLNYPHFRRNGITFHFQRFAHNSYIIYSVNAWRSALQDMRRYYSRKGCTYLIGYITELGSSNKIHA